MKASAAASLAPVRKWVYILWPTVPWQKIVMLPLPEIGVHIEVCLKVLEGDICWLA